MSIAIKKPFTEIYNVLMANGDKKVEEVLPLLMSMMESKQRDKNHRISADGILEIFCYYHKEWERVDQVEYGSKANSTTGYNTMCKIGVNNWTKQQRDFKEAKANMIDQVNEGIIDMADVSDHLEKLEAMKDKIIPLEETHEEAASLYAISS